MALGTICFSLCSCGATDVMPRAAGKIPIQHNGRIKSFDVFSRETLRLISGKETWGQEPAVSVIFKNLHDPKKFLEIPFIRVDHLELKKAVDLSADKKYFSYRELKSCVPLLLTLIQSAKDKRQRELTLTSTEQAAELLYTRLLTVDDLAAQEYIKTIPTATLEWESPYKTSGLLAENFRVLTLLYSKGSLDFVGLAGQWSRDIERHSPEVFAPYVYLENIYYQLKPFLWAWVLYLIAFIFVSFFSSKSLLRMTGVTLVLAGFLFHSAGLLLRVIILGRPPVSNMYESIIFMNWILVAGAFIFFLSKKQYFVLSVAALTGALVMIFADLLPVEKSLDVLVPVLKSNYWLAIHVLTIVSSYGIFGLAMALGHRHLFLNALGKFSENSEAVSAHMINRLLQAGLIALGIGTILGGVWANESWGRFWGWDPKETWALITFLGYMVIVHFRHAGKLSNKALAVGAILGFLLVLMTWYGVNFILGKGLHSYGFGAGQSAWIVYYLIFEAAFFAFVGIRKSLKTS